MFLDVCVVVVQVTDFVDLLRVTEVEVLWDPKIRTFLRVPQQGPETTCKNA